MSATYSIETPYPLLSVPRSSDSVRSVIHTGSSCTVTGSRKRKRTEVVIASDGESIGLYNVKTPRLVTSLPVPPQSRFTASPTCCCIKFERKKPAERLTYAAVRHHGQRKHELLCFHEELPRSSSTTYRQRKTSVTIGTSDDPVIFHDGIPSNDSTAEDSIDVITLQKNGQLVCYSQELDREHWRHHLFAAPRTAEQPEPITDAEVEYACILDIKTVMRSDLGKRTDIAAITGPNADQETTEFTSILCLVTRDKSPKPARHFTKYAIRPRWSVPNQQSILQLVNTSKIPVPEDVEATSTPLKSTFSFDTKTGRLQQLTGSSIIVYSFEDVTPRVFSHLEPRGEQPLSTIPLDLTSVLVNTSTHVSIYDVRYHSIQAQQSSFLDKQSRKPKLTYQGPRGDNLRLISFYSDINLAVGVSGEHVIAIEVKTPSSKKTSKPRYSRLIDSFGKGGVADNPLGLLEAQEEGQQGWKQKEDELNHFVKINDIPRFEELFSNVVGLDYWNESLSIPKLSKSLSSSERHLQGHRRSERTGFGLELPTRVQDMHAKSLYALNKIFAWNTGRTRPMALTERPSALYIKFLPPAVLAWLNLEGHLVPHTIEKALRLRDDKVVAPGSITHLHIINAIANADHSLIILSEILTTSPYIPLHGILNGLSVLIQSFSGPNETPALDNRLLTNGDATSGQAVSKRDHATARDLELLVAEETVMQDIALVNNILDSGSSQRQMALSFCLEKLATCYNAADLAKSMHTHLSRHETILLVQFLRRELTKGGWGTSLLDKDCPTKDDELDVPGDGTLPAICSLLSAALDALGTGGWLTEQNPAQFRPTSTHESSSLREIAMLDSAQAAHEEEGDDVITLLREETSTILEGVQESAFFQHFLRDFLRFEDAVRSALPETSSRKRKRSRGDALASTENPELRRLARATKSRSSMLPMGRSGVQKIENRKVGLDGELKAKSRRHVGGIVSKGVGKYTFETLEV